jgi:leader peptidase (prepilin peptidase) / N-methyltransferase
VDDDVLRAIVALPFGLVVGSFMTVAVHRLPTGESVVGPRSRCPSCGATIRARDNVPVLSWLLLRGRCRKCGERISVMYPLIELGTAGLVVLAAIRYSDPWQAVLIAGLLALMPGIAVIDLRHRIIPNRLTYPSMLVAALLILLAWLIDDAVDPVRAALGLLLYCGGLFVVAAVSRGMGMGDVKLAVFLGAALSEAVVAAIAVAVLAAFFAALGVLLRKGVEGRKSAIPFGPFLALGAVIAIFFG